LGWCSENEVRGQYDGGKYCDPEEDSKYLHDQTVPTCQPSEQQGSAAVPAAVHPCRIWRRSANIGRRPG
jgi:hypothetical protein